MRHVPGAVDGIRAALEWAGLEYDYGVCRCILDVSREELSVCNRPREGRTACTVLSSLFSTIQIIFAYWKPINSLNGLTFTEPMPTSSSSQDMRIAVFVHQIPWQKHAKSLHVQDLISHTTRGVCTLRMKKSRGASVQVKNQPSGLMYSSLRPFCERLTDS